MSAPKTGEFQEVAHSGGQITFSVVTDAEGHRAYQIGWKHSRPTPSAIFAVYALPEGIPVGIIKLGGIGQPWNAPPVQNCVPVFIARTRRVSSATNAASVRDIGEAVGLPSCAHTVECTANAMSSSATRN